MANPVAFHRSRMSSTPAAAPAITTLAMLDEEADFAPLDDLLQKLRPEACESIEFQDDLNGLRRYLKYNASIRYGSQRGTDSRWEVEGKFTPVSVTVRVQSGWDIALIARLIISEIEAEIDYAVNY